MQAINIFGLKFTRSRVEEPVQPISKDDLADEIQSDSYAESRKRNSSEAAFETSERKPTKQIYIKYFLTHDLFIFIPAALKRLDTSGSSSQLDGPSADNTTTLPTISRIDKQPTILAKNYRLKILRQASFLSKIMYVNNEGSNHWMAAWFDGNTRAEAMTIFEYRELIDQFPTVERQIRDRVGKENSLCFIGDKTAKIIPEGLTMERTIPLPIPTQVVATGKPYRSNHRNGLTNKAYRELVRRREEESRHVQAEQVGLGLAQCFESSAIVSKVQPELARGLENSLAHVRVPYQSFDSHCLLFAVFNLLAGFPKAIKRLVFDTVEARTGGAQLYDWTDINPVLKHVGISISPPKLDLTEDRLKGLLALQEGMFVVTYRGHAVGIDCKRRLIFDCAFQFAVELSNDGFVQCDILAAQHIRQIVVNDSRRRNLVSGAKDAEFLKLLKATMFKLFCVI